MRKVKKFQRKLTADWNKEIRSHINDVIKHRLGDSELLHNKAIQQVEKPLVKFCSGSTYEGQWNSLGFSGYGTYVYPHGAKYEGDFWDGQFHGHGTITYPKGQQLIGTWEHGRIVAYSYKFSDGLELGDKFDYCQQLDRRYQVEKNNRLQPPGKELLTNHQPTLKMPKKCYDTVDGYYNPKTRLVYGYDNHVMRVVTVDEEKQIKEKYRQEADKPAIFIEGMYKYWTSGRKREIEELEELVQREVKSEEPTTESSTQKSMSIYSFHMGAIKFGNHSV